MGQGTEPVADVEEFSDHFSGLLVWATAGVHVLPFSPALILPSRNRSEAGASGLSRAQPQRQLALHCPQCGTGGGGGGKLRLGLRPLEEAAGARPLLSNPPCAL